MTNATQKQTWEKTQDRSGDYGAAYESNDGWAIEVVLRDVPVSATSRAVRYVVCHYRLFDPKGGEKAFSSLGDAKKYAATNDSIID